MTPAAAVRRRGRSRRYRARNGLGTLAFESYRAQEPNACAGRDEGAQGRPHRRPWRRRATASMADPARASKRGGKQGGLTRKLTLNAVEMVEKAGVVQRRWIR